MVTATFVMFFDTGTFWVVTHVDLLLSPVNLLGLTPFVRNRRPDLAERARGCMLGLMVGDALGAAVEGFPPEAVRGIV